VSLPLRFLMMGVVLFGGSPRAFRNYSRPYSVYIGAVIKQGLTSNFFIHLNFKTGIMGCTHCINLCERTEPLLMTRDFVRRLNAPYDFKIPNPLYIENCRRLIRSGTGLKNVLAI
jgi:hypothetical protein